MAHNRLCIYIIHYVQFIILGENPGIWKLWTDYEHYELRLAATRHAVVALELSPWSVEQISNPGHRGPLPRWTARQMEG